MRNVFVFAGSPLKNLTDPSDGFEDNVLIGLGYQQSWTSLDALMFGWEAGLAGRFGEKNSLEAWGGLFARYDIDLG